MTRAPLVALFSFLLAACSSAPIDLVPEQRERNLDAIATDYVVLVLAANRHDEGFVDAYYGPAAFQDQAKQDSRTLAELIDAAGELRAEVMQRKFGEDADSLARQNYLAKQLLAVATRLKVVSGEKIPFDQESRNLYDTTAPHFSEQHFQAILAKIEKMIPGKGPLAERVEEFREQFVIPPDRLAAVFDVAIAACRERTLQHLVLPAEENFTLEFVTDQPWSGYNWYQGGVTSLIQVNTDLPIFIDRAVDLGCHEGYPGHHTYNALLETELVHKRGWFEFTVYPLFSPQSLIAEGSANYGIEMAFPGDARYQFERDVLMPLAGIDTRDADAYRELREAMAALSYAGNEAARRYLDGEITRAQAVDWLVTYTLTSPQRASQRVDFFDRYRSYVINYNHGKDLVARYIERHAATEAERWQKFGELLGSPMLPSDIDADDIMHDE